MATVKVRGAEIAYERSGTGPDMIWGHGLSQTRASDLDSGWMQYSRLPVTLVRYDARGHGESESTPDLEGYSWRELALDQLALADALGIDTYICGGASMGCGTALHVAVAAPERVRGLILVIPPTGWETRAAQAGQWMDFADIIESTGVEDMIAARSQLPQPDPYEGDESRRETAAKHTRAWDPKRLAHVMRGATRANFPDREAVASITAPVLILAWTGDPVHPVSSAEELHRLLPHAAMHVASTAADLEAWTDHAAGFITSLD
ncbi:MAG: alpha/beta fold hydrolase [Acidimicrobiia bacterium]